MEQKAGKQCKTALYPNIIFLNPAFKEVSMTSSVELAGRLSAIVDLQQQILGAATDATAVTSLIVAQIIQICGGSGAVIELVEGTDLVYAGASGTAERHLGFRLPIASSLSGLSVTRNELIRSDDVELDPRADIAACREIGIRSMIIAPLPQKDGPLGALKLFWARPNGFSDLDSYSVQLIAGITSAALQHARAYEQRQHSEERYRLLFEKNAAGVFRTSLGGNILDCNAAMVSFLGYSSRDELLQQDSRNLYTDGAEREQMLANLKQHEALTNVRLSLRRKDGSVFTALVNTVLITASTGEAQLLGTLVAAPA